MKTLDTQAANRHVAIYWDTENIFAALYDIKYKNGSWQIDFKSGTQDERSLAVDIDFDRVYRFARARGPVVVNRAYVDWTDPKFARLIGPTTQAGIDAVQVFPLRAGKNAADMRMTIGAMHDVENDERITDVVIVAGDADFVPLADWCRNRGIDVAFVSESSKTANVIETAHSFHDIRRLSGGPGKGSVALGDVLAQVAASLPDGQVLSADAIEVLVRRRGGEGSKADILLAISAAVDFGLLREDPHGFTVSLRELLFSPAATSGAEDLPKAIEPEPERGSVRLLGRAQSTVARAVTEVLGAINRRAGK